MRRAVILAAALLATGGCRFEEEPVPQVTPAPATGTQPTSPPGAGAVTAGSELEALIAKQGSVTFLSHDGKWIGTDVDSDITFLPNGVAHTFSYSDAMIGYRGTFTAAADGTVVVEFPTLGEPWPTMTLRGDATSLLLSPKEPAGRAEPAERSDWPFRQIPAAHEAQMREDIRTRGGR